MSPWLREFLYVDVEKVRGLLAQLDEGIIEQETRTQIGSKTTSGGIKGFIAHEQDWGRETAAQKTFGDALFPILESAIESTGALRDISDFVADSSYWHSGRLANDCPAGTIVRVTGPGHLFDSRFVAKTFGNFVTASVGLQNLGVMGTQDSSAAPSVPRSARGKATSPKEPRRRPPRRASGDHGRDEALELEIPDDFTALDDLESRTLHGIIQVARGVFRPGLYLNVTPVDSDPDCVFQVRLEEGRAFLDSEPDVLFSRYGVGAQNWTVVGLVGHHAAQPLEEMSADGNFLGADQTVRRTQFSQYVNAFMQYLGQTGFVDLVQQPAASLIPIAVYRVLNPGAQTSLVPASPIG